MPDETSSASSALEPRTPAAIQARLTALQGDVAESLQSQFGSTVEDLRQLRALLGDATAKLSGAFQTMVAQARDQTRLAEDVLRENDSAPGRQLHALSSEISKGAQLVVQSLQFEDMATQLLQHVDRRIGWLEAFARDASVLRAAVREDLIGMTYPEFVQVEERIAEHRLRAGEWAHKSVRQQSLDEGDIELF